MAAEEAVQVAVVVAEVEEAVVEGELLLGSEMAGYRKPPKQAVVL